MAIIPTKEQDRLKLKVEMISIRTGNPDAKTRVLTETEDEEITPNPNRETTGKSEN